MTEHVASSPPRGPPPNTNKDVGEVVEEVVDGFGYVFGEVLEEVLYGFGEVFGEVLGSFRRFLGGKNLKKLKF